MFNKIKFTNYFILTLLILSSGSVLNILGINHFIQILVFTLITAIAFVNGILWKKECLATLLLLLFGTLIVFFIQATTSGNFSDFYNNNNISFLLLLSTCVLVCFYFYSKLSFLVCLNSILFVFVLHGIFSAVLLSIFPTGHVLFSEVMSGNGLNKYGTKFVGYFFLFFQRVHFDYLGNLDPYYVDYFGFYLQRAHGLAWEPGNFSAYTNIFIFLNLFIFKNRRNVVLGCIGILASWSTAGMFVMLVQISYYLIANINKFRLKYILPKLLIIGFVGSFLIIGFSENFYNKLYGERQGSGAVRVVNTLVTLKTIVNNPWIGTGLYYDRYMSVLSSSLQISKSTTEEHINSSSVKHASSTNSFLRLYVQFGIPLGLLFTIALFKQTLVPDKKYLFAIIIILSVSSSPLMMTPFFFLFIVSGLLNMIGFRNNNSYKIVQ
jgi:hypothetical protein